MALIVADRVKETTNTTGTGTLSLAGAVAGFQSFVAGVGTTNTTYYAITASATGDWEVGIGTVTSGSPDTLSRGTVLESSNSDNLVNFGAGQKIVICTQPAEKAVYLDASDNLVITGTVSSSGVTVNGLLSATTKSFVIDHPTKDGFKLRYGSLEGPENGVYVRGRTRENIIELPDYWEGLVDEESVTVNITPIGRDQGIYVESWDNQRIVLAGTAIDCFYTVYGERKDVDPFEVEYEE